MSQKFWRNRQPGILALHDSFAQTSRIPVNHDGGQQIERGHSVVLAFRGSVPDLALSPDPECIL